MSKIKRTAAGKALTDFILDLSRVNSLLLTAGDRLVAGLGLTSARWQILGAVSGAERPQPVAWLARNLGTNRQNVQRIINDLFKAGLVTFEPNPHHRRAQLVVITGKGREMLNATDRLQIPWVNNLANGLVPKDLEAAHHFLATLRRQVAGNDNAKTARWRAPRDARGGTAARKRIISKRPPAAAAGVIGSSGG